MEFKRITIKEQKRRSKISNGKAALNELQILRNNLALPELEHNARKVVMFIISDYGLNKACQCIRKNLIKHILRGEYDHDQAKKSYYNLVVDGLHAYHREFRETNLWYTLLNVPQRKQAAEYLQIYYLYVLIQELENTIKDI